MRELKFSGIAELIAKQVKVCQGHLEGIREQDKACHDEFDHLVFQFRLYQIEAILKWLQFCEKSFTH